MEISRLGDALSKLESVGSGGGKKVFAREYRSGARTYTIMTPGDAWTETKGTKSPHLYEVLSGPCNMYLDIEWKCKARPHDEKVRVDSIIAQTVASIRHEYKSGDVTVDRVTASGEVPGGYKCSWHITIRCKGICWENAAAAGEFVKRNLADVPEVDKTPYNAPKQNWRCVGSSKASDPSRVFRPTTEESFMAGIVGQRVGSREVVVSSAPLTRAVAYSVPPAVERLIASLGDMRMHSTIEMGGRFLCVPFRERVVCTIAGRKHRSNHQYAIVDMQGMRWRMKCHNEQCACTLDRWRMFEDVDLAREAWNAVHRDPEKMPQMPPVKLAGRPPAGTSAKPMLRTRGPPPAGAWKGTTQDYIHCKDGIYQRPDL